MKFKQAAVKVAQFLRKNIYYVLIIVCIGAIATMVLVTVSRNNRDIDPTDNPSIVDPAPDTEDPNTDLPIDNTDPEPVVIVFSSPVDNATVGMGYSDSALVMNVTLNQYQVHEGIDFIAPEGSAVKAVFDGTVLSITTDSFDGTAITIDHGDGLYSVYRSLGSVSVTVGQKVTTGKQIGTVSTSMTSEAAVGSHLHFEVLENGVLIDPMTYLVNEEK